MKTNKVKVDLNALSIGKIIVNGKDISYKVSELTICARPGEVPEITLTIPSEVKVEIEGILAVNGEELE